MIVPIFLPTSAAKPLYLLRSDAITDIEATDLQTRIDQSLAGRRNPVEVGLYGGNIFRVTTGSCEALISVLTVTGPRSLILDFNKTSAHKP